MEDRLRTRRGKRQKDEVPQTTAQPIPTSLIEAWKQSRLGRVGVGAASRSMAAHSSFKDTRRRLHSGQ
jgi:hypothetical protein